MNSIRDYEDDDDDDDEMFISFWRWKTKCKNVAQQK